MRQHQEDLSMSRNKLKEQVYITGVGCSRFGDLLNTPDLKGLSV